MGKRVIFSMVVFFMSVAALGAGTARQTLLWDGFVLRSVDGKMNGPDGNDGWFFELDSGASGDRAVLKAGTRLGLLPSATLEKMTDDVKIRSAANYRLWGTVTKYKGKNFIYPIYFLPLSRIDQPQTQAPQKPQQQEGKPAETTSVEVVWEPTINEPNDALTIPQEIIERIRTRRVEPAKQPDSEIRRQEKPAVQPFPQRAVQTLSQDSILADRTALLVRQDDGRLVFALNAFGRNAPEILLRLLPCEALELTEQRQSTELEPLCFKIAGVVTEYKGVGYLLLQKATRVYSHGNFAR